MEKIVLDLKPLKTVKFDFHGNEIEVRPLMTLSEQILHINNYVDQYFFPTSATTNIEKCAYDFIGAEFYLAASIIDTFTNVRVLGDNGEVLIDADDLYSRGLWEQVRSHITNYSSFKENLDRVVEDIKEQMALMKSVGSVIDDLYEKIAEFLKGASQMDEESLKQLMETFRNVVAEVKESPISGLMAEGSKPKGRPRKNNNSQKKA